MKIDTSPTPSPIGSSNFESIFYATHNEIPDEIDVIGTSLKGYVNATYEQLVDAFGEPMQGTDKTDFEWHVLFAEYGECTIYNWKNGPNYLGDDSIDVKAMTEWNIGGRSKMVKDGVSIATNCEVISK